MATVISTTFKFKRGTSKRWEELNPVLAQGEPGFEIDTGKLKIGNGTDAWVDLRYIGDSSESGIVSVQTIDMLPETGDANLVYRIVDERSLYQWNSEKNIYELLNSMDDIEVNVNNLVQTEGDYLILYGGSATDNI